MSDVPLGVFLSGGIDSSTNVAVMSKLMNGPVKTFNVAIAGLYNYDESSCAESVSRYFNTDYRSMRIEFDDFYKLFNDLAYHTDEPLCDYACVANFYLAKLARGTGVPVIQVGEGNDEIFCGYRSYAAILDIIKHYYPLPKFVKKPLLYLFRSIFKDRLHYTIEQAARGEEVFLGSSYLFTEKEKSVLFNDSVDLTWLDSPASYVSRIFDNFLKKFPQADQLDKMIYLDLKLRLPELLLMRSDKMTMANSVEARFPFLDYQFVEYVLSLPSEFKCRHGKTKYIFKKSLKGILPKEVILQTKRGFAGNPVNIFGKDFQKYVLELYKATEPLLAEHFNLDNIRNRLIFDTEKTGFREGSKIWSIFSLMLWLRRFFVQKLE
jgi:asparagine synthase (glutamine-hydrolysing)